MKKIFYWMPVVLVISVASCKSDDKKTDPQATPATTTTTPATNTATNSSNFTANPAGTTTPPVVIQPNTAQPASVPAPNTKTTVAAGMNPAHGEPGHRCDIPVGAPLNSPKGSNPAVTTTPVVTTSQPVPAQQTVTVPTVTTNTPAKTAPGMNPAHGEPGHRCDIAVGAPLSSAPATVKPTGANTPVSISAPTIKQ